MDLDPRRGLERYLGRDVTIVLGELDNDGASRLLEVSPAAVAQGANRLVRLAGVGHMAADVLAAPQTREIVFG